MSARRLLCLVGVLAVGVLAGSGLGAFAHPPPGDPCSDFGTLAEGSLSGGSLELWPLGLRCDYVSGGRLARSERFGPSVAELYAWVVAAALLAALALLRRASAPVRGAALAAALLAMAGASWQFAGIQLALNANGLLGAPIVLALDHLLRPPASREFTASLLVAIAIAAVAFCANLVVAFEPLAGVAFGLLAGALASLGLARVRRPRGA